MKINLTLNGTARSADVPERTLLADLLRDTFGMHALPRTRAQEWWSVHGW